ELVESKLNTITISPHSQTMILSVLAMRLIHCGSQAGMNTELADEAGAACCGAQRCMMARSQATELLQSSRGQADTSTIGLQRLSRDIVRQEKADRQDKVG
ncbi:hypothetical protein HaLaN_01204, partial [Haematococcus lacustris]